MAPEFPSLVARLREPSDSHCIQSLRRNAAAVLALAGGASYGLPKLLLWLEARDDKGLAGDRSEEAEELMELEALAWERASEPTVSKRLVAAAEREAKAHQQTAAARQAELRLKCVAREEARRRGQAWPARQQLEQAFKAPSAAPAAPKQRERCSKKCSKAMAKQIDDLLWDINHLEDPMDQPFEEFPHEALAATAEQVLKEVLRPDAAEADQPEPEPARAMVIEPYPPAPAAPPAAAAPVAAAAPRCDVFSIVSAAVADAPDPVAAWLQGTALTQLLELNRAKGGRGRAAAKAEATMLQLIRHLGEQA